MWEGRKQLAPKARRTKTKSEVQEEQVEAWWSGMASRKGKAGKQAVAAGITAAEDESTRVLASKLSQTASNSTTATLTATNDNITSTSSPTAGPANVTSSSTPLRLVWPPRSRREVHVRLSSQL